MLPPATNCETNLRDKPGVRGPTEERGRGRPPTSILRFGTCLARPTRNAGVCRVKGVLFSFHAFLRLPFPRWAYSSPGTWPHQGSSRPGLRLLMGTAPRSSSLEDLLQRVRGE